MEQDKILLLYTGGTIGMIADERNGSLKPFEFDNLLQHIPDLARMNCQIDTDGFDQPIDSSDFDPKAWARLARRIEKSYYDYDAFIILHGSDTMAYTSSALSFMLNNLSKPVIFTGSQLPIGVPRSDARENLLTAIEIARSKNEEGGAKVPEVAVYFEYDLFRGNRLRKVSAEDFEAFQSINYPKLAEAGVSIKFNESAIAKASVGAFSINTNFNNEVGVLTVFPGMSPHFYRAVLENQALKAAIMRSFGSGNAPTNAVFLNSIRKARERGLLLINVSQCDGGQVQLGKYEASQHLLDLGVISAHDMTFEAAITKLMYLLAQDLGEAEFKTRYTSNLKGELSP